MSWPDFKKIKTPEIMKTGVKIPNFTNESKDLWYI